jgi:hypothetical protein
MQLRKTQTLTIKEIDLASSTPLLPALRRRNNSLAIGDEMLSQYLSGDTQVREKERRLRRYARCCVCQGLHACCACARIHIQEKGVGVMSVLGGSCAGP